MKAKVILFGLILSVLGLSAQAKTFFCYWGTWANYRQGNGKFTVNDIDPHLCTHVIYTFFGITLEGRIRILDPYLDLTENWGLGFIEKFNDLKRYNPNLKTLAAVGGWNEGSFRFSEVAKTAHGRQTFSQEAVDFCLRHGFDGFDLDWEYPGQRDGDPVVDKANFVLLVREMGAKLHQHGLLFTAAVAAAEASASISYNIAEISKDLDYINVMAYDFNGAWDSTTGINAPLHPGDLDVTPLQRQRNVEASIQYWLAQGTPREKLVLGMPVYGRTFALRDPSYTGVGAPASGPGQGGQYTNEPGFLGYNEFCERQLQQPWNKRWEDKQMVPYAFLGNQWIGYDDVESISLKSWYARSQNLGGVMVWSIETDDFRNVCGGGRNPLMTTMRSIYMDGVPPPSPPPTEPTEPTLPTTTDPNVPTQPGDPSCPVDGIFRDPYDCAAFYICVNGVKHDFRCEHGLLFDPTIGACNWPDQVQC